MAPEDDMNSPGKTPRRTVAGDDERHRQSAPHLIGRHFPGRGRRPVSRARSATGTETSQRGARTGTTAGGTWLHCRRQRRHRPRYGPRG